MFTICVTDLGHLSLVIKLREETVVNRFEFGNFNNTFYYKIKPTSNNLTDSMDT